MDKWQGRVACVTGASGGIGANITKALADAGMTVIGLSRRIEPIHVCLCVCNSKSLLISFYLYLLIFCCWFAPSRRKCCAPRRNDNDGNDDFARNWPIKQKLAKLLQRSVMLQMKSKY